MRGAAPTPRLPALLAAALLYLPFPALGGGPEDTAASVEEASSGDTTASGDSTASADAAASAVAEAASETAAAGSPPWLPGHVRVQLAGSLGLLSGGGGWSFLRDRVQAEILYGYAPSSVAGIGVHTLSQKSTAAPFAIRRPGGLVFHPLLLGYSANFALGDSYTLILPDHYQGYYWPSGMHFWIFAGTRAGLRNPGTGAIRKVSAAAEVGAVDAYWHAWWMNDVLDLDEILTLSLAVQVHFRAD